MKRVTVDDVDARMGPADTKRKLGDALGATDMTLNYYELEPGDSFGFGYHRHSEQEEVFYIAEGTVTFDTEDGEIAATAGECVRFEPGEWQLGTNGGDERVIALAMGAPQEMGETEMLRFCDDCDSQTEQDLELTDDRDAILTVCVECGAKTAQFE